MRDPIAARVARRFLAVELGYGLEGVGLTHQADFAPVTPCVRCGQEARLALSALESGLTVY